MQTISVKDAIESRHSIRKFINEPIPQKDLDEILELTRLAPSAWNLQPWRIHVVTDSTLKEKLEEAAYGQKQVTSASAVVLVISDMEDVLAHLEDIVHPGLSVERQREEVTNLSSIFNGMGIEERGQWGLTQTNIALGFFLLAVQSLGYGSVPMLGFEQGKVKEILGLPDHIKFAAMVPIGRPEEENYPHHRLDLSRIVTVH